jgi:glycosyltransferase involved in cell wall biosynthesis
VTQRFRPLIGGAESVLGELARELVRLEQEVTVVTARWEPNWTTEERVDDVEIVRLPMPRVRVWGTWRFMQALARWLGKRGRGFDVWYVSMLKHAAWVCVSSGRRRRVPVVLRPEGSGPTGDVAWHEQSLGGKLIRRRCRQATGVVALSSHIREELERAGYPTNRIWSIPNGVPIPDLEEPWERLAWRQRLDIDASGPLAVFVGRLSPEKGLADLIAAWKRVQHVVHDARLAIVGNGPQEPELRQQAAGQPSILWTGPTLEPQRYLRAADLFVLPSHEEGMSIALLEAMACAMPIVASDIPGNRRLIESGCHGLLVPPNRPDLLAQAMLVPLQAKTLAGAMGRAARRRVEEEFSITHMARRHLELFESLVRNK